MTDRPDRPTDPTTGPAATDRTTGRAASTVDPTGQPTTDRSTDEPTVLRVGLSVAMWVMSGIATVLAASGQLGFADWAGVRGANRYAVPAILELFAVVLLLLGYRQGRRRRSPVALWLLAAAIGAFAVYTNVRHSGPRAGLIFGAASAATILAWWVKLRLDLTHYLERIGHIPPARPKLGKLLLVAPRVAARAWIIAIRRRITSGDRAVLLAEVWVAVYADLRAGRVARRLARRAAWTEVHRLSGGVVAPLPESVDVPTVQVGRVASLASVEPTVPEETTERPVPPTRTRPTRVARPAARSTSLRLVGRSAAANNAAELRRRYPDGLPSVGSIRRDLGWSFDRATAAVKAYEAGDDKEDVA